MKRRYLFFFAPLLIALINPAITSASLVNYTGSGWTADAGGTEQFIVAQMTIEDQLRNEYSGFIVPVNEIERGEEYNFSIYDWSLTINGITYSGSGPQVNGHIHAYASVLGYLEPGTASWGDGYSNWSASPVDLGSDFADPFSSAFGLLPVALELWWPELYSSGSCEYSTEKNGISGGVYHPSCIVLNITPVPEPSMAALLASSLSGAGWFALRRKKNG